MTIESLLVAKNRDKFNNIISFMRSLIIKNEVEGDECETVDTASDYSRYEGAYLKHDSVLSYSYTYGDLINFGFTELDAMKYSSDPRKLQSDYMLGKTLCKSFVSNLRKKRMSEYTENNSYYRQFCGLPYDSDQYIEVENDDKESDDDPDKIYLHEVTLSKYPKTYSRLYYEREIESIYTQYDYLYLTFIENPLDPYVIRNKGQFEICYYDKTYLDSSELSYWFEVYDIARNEILTIDYIEAFQNSYKAYVNVMFLFILQYAFNLYCSKMLERYAIRDYSDAEIYDILDSNGLGNLKSLNISLLKRIVNRLPDLKTYTGTNKVIDILFDIVADDSLTVKRYYLNKKYNIDTEGNTNVKSDDLYNKSVDLVFIEKTTNRGSDASNTIDVEYPYEDIVMADDTWGGTIGVDDDETKLAIKNDMKKELLAADFNSIMTKYIGLTKIIDMHVKLTDVNYKLGLLYQFDSMNNILKSDSVVFNGVETTPVCLYAAWCLVYGMINDLSDPDQIISDESLIEGIMKLRTTDKISEDSLKLSNVTIDLGNGYSRKLKDYLTDEEIQSNLVGFNYSSDTAITDILSEYDKNYEIIEYIQDKLENSYDYGEYKVWETLLNANLASSAIKSLFGSSTSYSGFMKQDSPNFYENFTILLGSAKTKSDLRDLFSDLHTSFSNYLSDISNGELLYATTEDDVVGGEDLTDISMLFNQFMSVYTQLYKQDSHVSYDDKIENSMVLLYATCLDVFKTTDRDLLELSGKKMKDIFKTTGISDVLELLYYVTDTISTKDELELELEDELVREILKFVKMEYPELVYEKMKDIFKTKNTDDLSLSYELISDKLN